MAILILMSLTLCLTLLDIVIKSLIEGAIEEGEERRILGGRAMIRKVYNKGMTLNLLEGRPETVRLLSALVTMVITIYQLFTLMRRGMRLKKAGLSLMTAGAWSNTFDIWVRGYVIDYVGFKTKWEKITRITYNFGDFFIVAGSILMMLSSIFKSGRKSR